ncbi:hypothetical protein SAMN02927937_00048 [Paenimyroides aquimaris]|uniref:Uncharacterized protein n=1 Tax=Paenimyroides marinum TaxID=1159016 RepID=A0A1H6IWN6_9FLAO|nr:hypothetical protein [Paenimyroides aquimaris]SEH53789.1 hypothetical protein SAMN02927937_00048 [Paenimyroides aquimaris]
MKNYYLLFLLLTITISCSEDFNESAETVSLENYATNSVQANAPISLNTIVSQLVSGYTAVVSENTPATLTQKITLLDSVSLQNTAFLQIKPAGYTLISNTQAQRFLQNYEEEYTVLNTSAAVNDYFELIIAEEDNLTTIMGWVNTDTVLTNNEKQLLHFIISCLDNNPPPGSGDNDWSKKMIVAATLGFNQNTAQAVFNASLLIVY